MKKFLRFLIVGIFIAVAIIVSGCTPDNSGIADSVVQVRDLSDNTQSSGFIVSADGLILTFLWDRSHAESLEVVFSDGSTLPVVALDEKTSDLPYLLMSEAGVLPGLAYLKVDSEGLSTLEFVDEEDFSLATGVSVSLAGFGENGFKVIDTEIVFVSRGLPMVSSEVVVLGHAGEPLMEGGPVVDKNGRVVGVLLGLELEDGQGLMVPFDLLR